MGVDHDLLVYPQDELECGICLGLLEAPLETPCQHLFCEDELKMALQRQPLCPECRQHIELSRCRQPNYRIKNMIAKMLLYCDYKCEGCDEQIQYQDRDQHLNECQYKPVFCPFDGCLFHTMPRFHAYDIADHTSSCDYRIVRCRCGLKIALHLIPQHQSFECELREIVCDSCGQDVAVKDAGDHLKSHCPASELTCPHHILGCEAVFTRRELSGHLAECPFEALKGNLYTTHNNLNDVKRVIEDHNLRLVGTELSQLRKVVIQQAETVATLASQLQDEKEAREALWKHVTLLSTQVGVEVPRAHQRYAGREGTPQVRASNSSSSSGTGGARGDGSGERGSDDASAAADLGPGTVANGGHGATDVATISASSTPSPSPTLSPGKGTTTNTTTTTAAAAAAAGSGTAADAAPVSVVAAPGEQASRAMAHGPSHSELQAKSTTTTTTTTTTPTTTGKDSSSSHTRTPGHDNHNPRRHAERSYTSVSDITRLTKVYQSPGSYSSLRGAGAWGERDSDYAGQGRGVVGGGGNPSSSSFQYRSALSSLARERSKPKFTVADGSSTENPASARHDGSRPDQTAVPSTHTSATLDDDTYRQDILTPRRPRYATDSNLAYMTHIRDHDEEGHRGVHGMETSSGADRFLRHVDVNEYQFDDGS